MLRTRPRVIEGDIIIVPLVADMDGVDAELFTLGDTGKASGTSSTATHFA